MACGIPLVCSPWDDAEQLFTVDKDYLKANDSNEMKEKLLQIFSDDDFATRMAAHGLKTILEKHTCGHRVEQLESICMELGIKDNTVKNEIQQI